MDNQTNDSLELLDKKQAAEFCRVSEVTINRWMSTNKIAFIKIGARVLFRKSQLIKDLEKFTVPAEN